MYNNPEIIESSDIRAITAMSYTPAGPQGEPPLLVVTFALHGDREIADPPTRFLWPGMPAQLFEPVTLASLMPAPEEAPAEASPGAEETQASAPEAAQEPAPPEAPAKTTDTTAPPTASSGNGGSSKGSKNSPVVPLTSPTEGSGQSQGQG